MDALTLSNIIAEAIIAVAVTFSNLIVLITLCRNKKLWTVTNCLIASLAVADLLVGLLCIPFAILTLFGLPHEFYSCLFVNCLIVILLGTSLLNLLAVTIERFIAIQFLFWHRTHFTNRWAVILALSGWVLGAILGLVPMMGWNNGWNEDDICGFILIISLKQHVYFSFFGTILIPLVIMLLIYIAIFAAIRRSARQFPVSRVRDAERNEKGQGQNEERSPEKTSISPKEIRAAKRFSLVIGIFTICWIPLEVMNCVTVWYKTTCIPCVVVAVWLTHINSAINPLLYAYGNKSLGHAMKNTILCCRTTTSKGTNGPPSNSSQQTERSYL